MKLCFSIYLLFIAMLSLAQELKTCLETPYCIFPRQGTQYIDLSTDWQLSCADTELTDVGKRPGKSLVSVQYPTTVHTALYKAGVTSTKLKAELVANQFVSSDRDELKLRISNTGKIPAFMTKINITGIKRIFYASDNYFWLAPGESKEITLNVLWRELRKNMNIILDAEAWNSKKQWVKLDSQITRTQKL